MRFTSGDMIAARTSMLTEPTPNSSGETLTSCPEHMGKARPPRDNLQLCVSAPPLVGLDTIRSCEQFSSAKTVWIKCGEGGTQVWKQTSWETQTMEGDCRSPAAQAAVRF